MAMTQAQKELLNKFAESQPALQEAGKPASEAGIKLGDLLAAGSNPVAASVALLGTTAALVGVDGVGDNAAPLAGTESRLDAIEAKIDAVISALKAAGLMA